MRFRVAVEARTGAAGQEAATAEDLLSFLQGAEPVLDDPEVAQDAEAGTIGLRGYVEANDADAALRIAVRALAQGMVAAGLSATRGWIRLLAEPAPGDG